MSTFNNIKQALKRANHFAPVHKPSGMRTRLEIARRRYRKAALPRHLNAVGIPNGELLWDASEDYTTKLVTIDDIARGINRFIDNNRAANNFSLAYVLRWWRDLLFFDPKQLA